MRWFDCLWRARYALGMRARTLAPFVLAGLAWMIAPATGTGSDRQAEPSDPVPAEDYPIYNVVVRSKFVTSATQLVVIERLTATTLYPEQDKPTPRALPEQNEYFEGRLPADLMKDFVMKNSHPFRLESRFDFGVRYRFVSGDGAEQQEVSLSPLPVAFPRRDLVQDGPLPVIDRLAFSRVAFTSRKDQALVYVANTRPDGTGAGFLFWLHKPVDTWEIIDTEVLWVARVGGPPQGER